MLSGFPGVGEAAEGEEEEINTSKMVQDMNRKKKKSGGFQVWVFSYILLIRKPPVTDT